MRDKEAAYREQRLSTILKQTIPIPEIYFIGEYDEYRFAIIEYIPGMTLRDLLLGNELHDIGIIMHDVGILLSKIQAHFFPSAGFFDKNLNIRPFQSGYMTFASTCLEHPIIIEQLGKEKISKINFYLEKYKIFFPDESENHLVHADFDPANILIDRINGDWKITGVLDWEFSFAGSMLCDVANMLRYAHHMPALFEESFLQGLNEGGVPFPHDWQISIRILNLVSLLDCLVQCDSKQKPNQCTDICTLIQHIIHQLGK